MPKYIEEFHNVKGMITEYSSRTDLDTALKERELETGLYPKGSEEKKELDSFLERRARQIGRKEAIEEVRSGRMFNQEDVQKI